MDVKKRLSAGVLVVALAVVGILMNGGHETVKASPGAAPVNIVSPLPLPITGTATVSGTVGAKQSGPWSVNANVTFPASQGVTVNAAGPLTNVGRLPSKQVTLTSIVGAICPTFFAQVSSADGSTSCFDMANHPGEVLVITDYTWIGLAVSPGATCATAIINSSNPNNLYFSSAAVADSARIAAKTEHFTTGITLTGNPQIVQGKLISTFLASCDLLTPVQFTGYLMPNQ